MKACPFCTTSAAGSSDEPAPVQASCSGRQSSALVRRGFRAVEWLIPTAVLALMPKCPLCLAAYLALMTGVGISTSSATWLRILLIALCLGWLAYLAAHGVRQVVASAGAALAWRNRA